MKLLEMALKLPLFEQFCPHNVKERAEGLNNNKKDWFKFFLLLKYA